MSDYISKSELVDSIMKNVLITTEEGLELRGEIVDLIKNQPTLDETEIIRKAFERVLQRLDKQAGEFIDLSHRELSNNSIPAIKYLNKGFGVARAIEIVKEECGINE